ncbi:ABC transporter permease [Acidisoma cellulosilytica]|uniref:Histidine/lysine/arginine/ornithine transport system permease protein HisM n=1 Tax=Acidisoma cellulosilyticum TaxID=2802395 RepID=A0A963Z5D3_9PROT|nr:ABC transporter permease [Acidisoma cellulosilyticum]MCB8882365.1 ABC transporter permease [Acidisoma cellulosilyticum]
MIDIIQQYWRPLLYTDGYTMTGVAMTLWLLVISCLIGFCLAVPLAVARNARNPFIRLPVWTYVFVFTGTPLYVQLLIIYTGIYSLSIVQHTSFLNAFFRQGIDCTLLAFALNTGAYTTQIFAGAMRDMAFGEIEAARAIGMSGFTLYRRIIIPSSLRRALPLYSNEVILMLHSTTLAFTATVPDILKVANDANSATYEPFWSFGIAGVLYACISFTLIFTFRRAEHRFLAFLRR